MKITQQVRDIHSHLFNRLPSSFLAGLLPKIRCVHLRRRQVRMAHDRLHRLHIRPVPQKMRGEGVAQRMRRNIRSNAGLLSVKFNNFPEPLAAHNTAAAVNKKPLGFPAL